jgi:hypothetical protein
LPEKNYLPLFSWLNISKPKEEWMFQTNRRQVSGTFMICQFFQVKNRVRWFCHTLPLTVSHPGPPFPIHSPHSSQNYISKHQLDYSLFKTSQWLPLHLG